MQRPGSAGHEARTAGWGACGWGRAMVWHEGRATHVGLGAPTGPRPHARGAGRAGLPPPPPPPDERVETTQHSLAPGHSPFVCTRHATPPIYSSFVSLPGAFVTRTPSAWARSRMAFRPRAETLDAISAQYLRRRDGGGARRAHQKAARGGRAHSTRGGGPRDSLPVLHQEQVHLLRVVDDELVETVWQQVARLCVCAVA